MADVDQGVTGTDSPTEGTTAQQTDVQVQSSSTAQGVNPDSPAGSGAGTDRPDQNWYREFQRKQAEQDKRLEQVLTYLVSREQTQPPADRKGPVTKEELWALAQQGDQPAFEEYQRRIAQEVMQQKSVVDRRQQIVQGQLQALVAKYPVLNNPAHPLAQTTNHAYQLLVQNGYAQGPETLLEAAKTAIADRPDLVAEHYSQVSQTREQMRQDGTRRSQSGVMGGPRQDAPRANQPKVSDASSAMAARMGVKMKDGKPDAAGAMKRFRERQASGQSSLGAVAAFIPQEDQ